MKFDLKIALRDSDIATRPYVIVNPMLAKHLPVKPSEALECFRLLGGRISEICGGERVLVIGFAETATALGAAVASLIDNALYVHTTREMCLAAQTVDNRKCKLAAGFSEEHSHAKNQSLYLHDEYIDFSLYERLIFVEDEITTGKTILNFLKAINYSGKIIVSALVFNNFDESVFSEYSANFLCIQKVGYVNHLGFDGLSNPRLGVNINKYHKECLDLASKISKTINEYDIYDKDILVMGTEEFMFPALILGAELEKTAKSVKSQSTTRSPLLPQNKNSYPLYSRHEFSSVYDSGRTTYLYNLEKYDTVIIMTDALESNYNELINTIRNCGNEIIYYVRIKYAY